MKFVFLFLFFFHTLSGSEKTICLNMIVRNESHVIERCLNSVKGIIDYWVIVDTGSDDNTKEIIQNHLQDVPGELHERPWVNFGHNRQEALELAKDKSDYILFIDADEEFIYDAPFDKNSLSKDAYTFVIRNDQSQYHRLLLIKSCLAWYWKGAIHESLLCETPFEVALLEDVVCYSYVDGGRSLDPQKYYKDIALLKEDLKNDPNDSRAVFYIAQSYANIPDYENALKYYKKRSEMGGWEQEVYFSLQSIGKLEMLLEKPSDQFLKSLSSAYCYNPKRAEPLYYMAKHFMEKENYFLAYLISKNAIQVSFSQDAVYVEQWVYNWGVLLQYAECSFRLQKFQESLQVIDLLLTKQDLPKDIQNSLEKNQQMLLACLYSQ